MELAGNADTRKIVGVYRGARSRRAARGLWKSVPPVYRQCAVYSTDFWEAYKQVLPNYRHHAVGKQTGKTSYPIAVQQYLAAGRWAVGAIKPARSLRS